MRVNRLRRLVFCAVAVICTTSCVGMAIETATDAVIAVGKVPFKVGGAVIDVVTDDEDEKEEK